MLIQSKIGKTVGRFRYLRCLDANESTSNNQNPLYLAVCLDCGVERELRYRNRAPHCTNCGTKRSIHVDDSKQGPVQMLALYTETNLGRVVSAADKYNAYAKLTKHEQAYAKVFIIHANGTVEPVNRDDYVNSTMFSGRDLATFLDESANPVEPAVVEVPESDAVEETRRLQETFLGRAIRPDDSPPI